MAQGSIDITKIVPGDMIVSSQGTYGHVSVVDYVDTTNNVVNTVEQNDSSSGKASYSFDSTTKKLSRSSYYTISGVVHSPNNKIGNTAPSLPPAPPPTPNVPWNFENLDGDPYSVLRTDSNTGLNPVSVVYGSTLQTFYYDQQNGRLMHTWSDSSGWHSEVLDGAGGSNGRTTENVGKSPSVVINGTTLQVFYYNLSERTLRHAWSDSSGWHFETLDGNAASVSGQSGDMGSVSTAVMYGSSIQLFYPNLTNGDLRHAWTDSSGWHFENLDGDAGSKAGQKGNYAPSVGTSLTSIVYQNNLHVFYYSSAQQVLRHMWAASDGWHVETLDGNQGSISGYVGCVGQNPAATLLGTTLQLTYYDAAGNLRHSWNDNNGWHFENLDGVSSSIGGFHFAVGLYSSMVVNGTSLNIFYFDNTYGELRHAWQDSSGWHFENLDGLGGGSGRLQANVGSYVNAVLYGGKIQLLYYDATNGNLRHAWPW